MNSERAVHRAATTRRDHPGGPQGCGARREQPAATLATTTQILHQPDPSARRDRAGCPRRLARRRAEGWCGAVVRIVPAGSLMPPAVSAGPAAELNSFEVMCPWSRLAGGLRTGPWSVQGRLAEGAGEGARQRRGGGMRSVMSCGERRTSRRMRRTRHAPRAPCIAGSRSRRAPRGPAHAPGPETAARARRLGCGPDRGREGARKQKRWERGRSGLA